MDARKEKLLSLTRALFNEDCERINLEYKLQQINDNIARTEDSILHETAFPDRVEIYELSPFVLVVGPRDITALTEDQFEKIEGFLNEKL